MDKGKKGQISSQVMYLQDLISGPLVATIDADTISSRRYLNYLFELAFESYDQETGKAGPLRMLEFSYQTNDTDGQRTQKVSIPMLTLVPLPLLQVQEADFDFDIQIVEALQTDRNASFSLNDPSTPIENNKKDADDLRLRVMMAPQTSMQTSTKKNSTLTANMKVCVKMRQADMPGGLTKLLHLTTNNALSAEEETDNND